METQAKETHTRIRVEDLKTLKEIQTATNVDSLTEVLHNILTTKEPSALTLVNLLYEDLEYLKKIQKEVGSDLGHVIHQIIKSQSPIEPVTPSKVLETSVPILLCGKPLCGKSYWLANTFLPSIKEHSVVLIDTNSEHNYLKEIKSIRELTLQDSQHMRYVPVQHSLMGIMQVKSLFTELNMLVDMNKDALRNLILIVEEAQSYKSNWFNGFLYKSRHIVRKMIVVTPQTDCFLGLQSFTVFR